MATSFGTLDRRAAVKILLAGRTDLLIVTGLGSPAYDVFDAGDRDDTFYLWGAMGGAAMAGLGLALAQPSRPVVVVTGDGEQLMGAGALMTVAVARPGNLTIVVLDNGYYGETGMQVSHSGLGVRLDQVAAACGIPDVREIVDEAGLLACQPWLCQVSEGPRLAVVRIGAGHVERALPPRDGVFLKNRPRQQRGLPVSEPGRAAPAIQNAQRPSCTRTRISARIRPATAAAAIAGALSIGDANTSSRVMPGPANAAVSSCPSRTSA